ncbi:pimeloyl-ACP methyl ester carboxylesterase [Saccharopolyspora lacisalsi]|uniref:Pimeloyl-ACP methyl ester carboxylesterase n=1 Tax=Halosaccharopolyspora lacisalsi TaxID=1000566 RepID=A0A839DP89_9PSEU|nr:alpha/beta hydrolase [Halosaccharopolyspora lacisalsi]MBA8822810.1 pimeloyl-ACP methyl ester carboxylesterase [Halosaccharopolyspora lacisalsi]
MRVLNSDTHPFDEELVRGLTELSHDRPPLDPTASPRQANATIFRGDLADIRVPALGLHGESDPVLRVGAAHATAKAIPGARLVSYPGMGHFMPTALWTTIADETAILADRSRSTATSTTTGAAP